MDGIERDDQRPRPNGGQCDVYWFGLHGDGAEVSGGFVALGDAGGWDVAYTYDRRTARRWVRRYGGHFFKSGKDANGTVYQWRGRSINLGVLDISALASMCPSVFDTQHLESCGTVSLTGYLA